MLVKAKIEIFEEVIELDNGEKITFTFRKPSLVAIQDFQASLIIGDVTAEELQTGKYKIDYKKALDKDFYLLAYSILTISVVAEWSKMDIDMRVKELKELANINGELFKEIVERVKAKVGELI